ncbi:MAG: calcineurin-like phosphoesterase C-terminal domain-containing protein [Cyclobacteriaceae bacterium]|nr:calcineurin-like phosphoesterase C-terminal domain-containing protein [Cyclobacteriaceae bacterium]
MHFSYIFMLLTLNFYSPFVIAQDKAKGIIYSDNNGNGHRDRGERGLPGVLVSNGSMVVKTDKQGKWELPYDDDTGFFVIKPHGYVLPLNEFGSPAHYYLHKPNGSPELQVPGVEPTGPLPASIDFGLIPQAQSDTFSMLVFSDPQARGLKEVNYISHDVVEECFGTEAVFGITLGDIVADDPNLFEEVSRSTAQIGIPWYYAFGNHDNNRDAIEMEHNDETFERFFGPSSYAFEYGKVSFIVLRDIMFYETGKYKSEYTPAQLEFVKNYLNHIPEDRLIVIMQHAPIMITRNHRRLFEIIDQRPHTFSIAGHTHRMAHAFFGKEQHWQGVQPHHHFVTATVSGSWWCGLKDELGIPHATMNDGAPNGYSILHFTGNQYKIQFKAARRPADYQMNIFLDDDIAQASLDTTQVLVNVFAGSSRSRIEYRIKGHSDWMNMDYEPGRDPGNMKMHLLSPYLDIEKDGVKLDAIFGWKMDYPSVSTHIWKATLPVHLDMGTYTLEVRSYDMFEQQFYGRRIFRVRK